MPLADEQEAEETDVSLITGTLRSNVLLRDEPEESSCSSSVVLRNQMLTVANTNSAGTSNGRQTALPRIHELNLEFRMVNIASYATFVLLLSSLFPGGAKLAGPGAEAGRDACGKGRAGQKRHSYCL